jgi:hypothetical protein
MVSTGFKVDHRILENHRDPIAAHLADFVVGQLQKVLAIVTHPKEGLTGSNLTGRLRNQTHQ